MRTSYMRAARPPLVSRTRMRTRSESTARFAASAFDWRERFGRKPKEGARPLLILWPFGPVALVYDLMDTDGRDLPRDVWSFYARGHQRRDSARLSVDGGGRVMRCRTR